ncbi:TIM barrel protein [Psychromarinibacter sp. C21-152]|uniref:TIM barrel protein n=1 Tax=Psychromarinibacter sediminicola TaxID=3033385 RepID=A0AAE3NN99_9RHOB|nr:TIM barrel protein [Psychromarinibacter sediminicola]MDF0600463.1 TIM barrel protein [Psychromarinibacter sediminicola]
MRLSANLGFLFTDLPLTQAVAAAAGAGFGAVECHWPYDTPREALRAACTEAGVALLGLNTRKGGEGEFGLAALPGREPAAQTEIDLAIRYARAAGGTAVHVMAGLGGDARVFADNLAYAAQARDLTILIEPINTRDVPGYHLASTRDAMALQDRVGADNLKIMFDCYHQQIIEGDLFTRATSMLDRIGHIQIAAVPDRGEPDAGEVNYPWLLPALCDAGYAGWFGAEYRPRAGGTAPGLGWLDRFA